MTIGDQILYEDNHLMAINKLPGQITQGDKTGDPCLADLVKDYIKERDHKPGQVYCGVIHRLDRPVSGVVLLAKTIGCTLPIITKAMGADPALMAAPLLTSVVDAAALLVYFAIALQLLPL